MKVSSIFLLLIANILPLLSNCATSDAPQYINQNNLLLPFSKLDNRYYVLRHGQSLANVAKIISSDPKISTLQHGLSELGKEQVRASARMFCTDLKLEGENKRPEGEEERCDPLRVVIVSSDFLRARETAQILAEVLAKEGNIRPIVLASSSTMGDEISPEQIDNNCSNPGAMVNLDTRLRERYFGQFNGRSDSHYFDVWSIDAVDEEHTRWDVESVNSVMLRTTLLVSELEKCLSNLRFSSEQIGEGHANTSRCICILVAHGDVLQILQAAFQRRKGREHRKLTHLETGSIRELILAPIPDDSSVL